MKKTLAAILSLMLLLALGTAALAGPENMDCDTPWKSIEDLAPDDLADMFGDSYPYSVDYDWPECKSDPVITGTVIVGVADDGVTHCWSNGTDNASCAFDGDTLTFYDPYEASVRSWVGLALDQPYELTEVRICNRSGQEARIIGAAIQGSNDNGATWHNVVYFDPAIYGSSALLTNDYHIVTPAKNDEYVTIYQENSGLTEEQSDFSVYWVGTGSYSVYRYVNLVGTHGDCADIELYGHPADAYVGEEAEVAMPVIPEKGEYPISGTEGTIIKGEVIGNEMGWGDNPDAGAAAAFDGDPATFFDPLGVADGYAGIKADTTYVLEKVAILSRENNNARFVGALIQGSNDGENWTTLFESSEEGTYPVFYTIDKFAHNVGYTYFRYFNETNHGDVAEVEFYGYAGTAEDKPLAADAKSDGTEYDEAALAAAAIGSNPIVQYEFVSGTGSFDNEGPENLWDDDVTTKFCTTEFPASSIVATDGKFSINGIIMATANDNSSYNGRSPNAWTIYGSNDGDAWDPIASGDDTFFAEVDYTFFVAAIEPSAEYSYFKFECTGTDSATMQVSEVVLCSATAPSAAVEEPAPEPEPEPEPEPTVSDVVEDAAENVTEAVGDVVENVEDAVENVADNVADAASNAVEAVSNAAEKSGCGSFIGGGLIVMAAVLGSAWISRRK